MKRLFASALAVLWSAVTPAGAQILFSAGTNYSQNFDGLASSGTPNWTNNLTLPGWYAAKGATNPLTYTAGTGSGNSGSIYSFGASAASNRALGSLAASSLDYAFGVRFTNNTPFTATNFIITYTGEQWRSANTTNNTLAFSYQISSQPLTNADAINAQTWISFPSLNFVSPVTNGGSALDGNLATNQQLFSAVPLAGVVVQPGEELFLRWRDVDDTGSDAGLAVDDFSVRFTTNVFVAAPPPAPMLTNTSITLMTYNVKGNGVADWSTNTVQVQAIGRQLLYLKPDVITFNEIPRTNAWQMPNWVIAFMPGYFLATNSGDDGFIKSVIASRYPITRSQKWLDGASLNPFGYTNTSSSLADNFTRDLFQAQINVPNWPRPLHVFTTHLKSSSGTGGYTDAAAKRAAEAAAITNFFATNFFVLYPNDPFTLSGDMNEDNTNTIAIQRLISTNMKVRLMNPTNRFSGSLNTYDSGSPNSRIDHIFPGELLATNVTAMQVFRTDLLTPTPTNLLKFDSTNASDHLPVLMTFANPFNTPFKLLSLTRTNESLTFRWESQTNRTFHLESSTNLSAWTPFATNLFSASTNAVFTYTTNGGALPVRFFRVQRVP